MDPGGETRDDPQPEQRMRAAPGAEYREDLEVCCAHHAKQEKRD